MSCFWAKIKFKDYDNDFKFELYDFDNTNNQIIKVKYIGCYVIVNNGPGCVAKSNPTTSKVFPLGHMDTSRDSPSLAIYGRT